MRIRNQQLRQTIGVSFLVVLFLTGALAQDNGAPTVTQPRGMYVVMPPHLRNDVAPPAVSLQTWNGSYTYNGTNYSYNMVGAAPSTNTSATIPVFIIPVKIVI